MHSSQPHLFSSSLSNASSSSSSYSLQGLENDPFQSKDKPVYRGMTSMTMPEHANASIHTEVFDFEQYGTAPAQHHPINASMLSFQPLKQAASNPSTTGDDHLNFTKQLTDKFSTLTFPGMLPTSSVSAVVEPVYEFPDIPAHVERYSTLYVDTIASESFELVRDSCIQARDAERVRLDFQVEINHSQIHCLLWDAANEGLSFDINFYKTDTPASVLVEVQKRKGCSIVFNKFYGAFSAQIYQSALDKKLSARQYEASHGSRKSSPRFLAQPTFLSRPVMINNNNALSVNVTPNPDQASTPNPDQTGSSNEIFILASMSSPNSSYENIREALCILSSQISYSKVAEAAYKACSKDVSTIQTTDPKAAHPCKIMSNILTFLSEADLPAELVCSALHVLSSLAQKAKEENREQCMRGRLTSNPQLLQVLRLHLKAASDTQKTNIYSQEIQRSILTIFATFPCWLDDESKQEAKLYSLQSRDSQLPQWVKDTLNGL